MKAFISFAVNPSEQYIVSILSSILREQTFNITTNFSSPNSFAGINKANFFIGVVTSNNAEANKKVLADWHFALQQNTPALILVENSQYLNLFENLFAQQDSLKPNFIRFDKNDPTAAIQFVEQHSQQARQQIMTTNNQNNNNNGLAWVLGGLAALAVIKLFTAEKN